MYAAAAAMKPTSWTQVEADFLVGMEGFDANVVSGFATQGDWQNGKGDFFNDLLALVLEGCAGIDLYSRQAVPGLIVARNNLDVTYPNTGTAQFTLEAKAVGIPKHPRNTKQKNPLGRPGSADLDKRIKEGAFKVIDLKAEYGRIQTMSGQGGGAGPGGNLTNWLRLMKPTSYLFVAARVVGKADLARIVTQVQVAAQVFDQVGVFAYEPKSPSTPTSYKPVPNASIPASLQLEKVLYNACQDLTQIKASLP